jgi:glycosyltransferase involved in cell wall biosynthesis
MSSDRGYGDGLAGAQIVLDCRWLGLQGAGRATDLLLRELRRCPPPGTWVLWGRPGQLDARVIGGSVAPFEGDPRALLGQRSFGAIPRGDVTLYMHQIRPLRPGRSVTVIHDTIPLRYGGSLPTRLAKRAFFRAVARLSTHILTVSDFSKRCLVRDLGIDETRISVMHYPVDTDRARAIAQLRETVGQEPMLLYVGRFLRHKNLPRLCRAFVGSGFSAGGGKLLLAGGEPEEVCKLQLWLRRERIEGVDARGPCSEEELERLLATSRALIVPSLEEGYGLPAFEAAATGLPVAAGRTGALCELDPSLCVFFDPADTGDLARAIDAVTARAPGPAWQPHKASLREPVLGALAAALAG